MGEGVCVGVWMEIGISGVIRVMGVSIGSGLSGVAIDVGISAMGVSVLMGGIGSWVSMGVRLGRELVEVLRGSDCTGGSVFSSGSRGV